MFRYGAELPGAEPGRRESVSLDLLGDSHLVKGGTATRWPARCFVSEHTVQHHLKSVFAKTATNNRRMLLARALGT